MSAWQVRDFAGSADVPALLDLLLAGRQQDMADWVPTVAEWRVHCALLPPDRWADLGVWDDPTGRPVAWAFLDDEFGSLTYRVAPALTTGSLLDSVVAWAEDRLRRTNQGRAAPLPLRVPVREDAPTVTSYLEEAGFTLADRHVVRLQRDLAAPIAAPQLPPGYSVRTVAGPHEAAAVAAVQRAAFGTAFMTTERRLALMRDPAYRPDLDVVVAAPDGTLVAFCGGEISAEENARLGSREGWTDPIGTRPEQRRQGLARAAVLFGLQQLRRAGMATALMGTGSWNVAMLGVAEQVGFRVAYRLLWYTKAVG